MMNKKELGYYIGHFVYLNPKQNKYPNFNKYDLNSFLIIQNQFKENPKYIITSNYNDIFYNKHSILSGKKWVDIILSSKDIFEYHKKIRDDFPFCKQKKLTKTLLDDLFFWFEKNPNKIIIEATESHFDIELKQKLENIRYFLDKKDWSNYFFNLQKLMHEHIIKLLDWKNKPLNYRDFNKMLIQKLNVSISDLKLIENYNNTIQLINSYRNALSKSTSIINNKFVEWNSKNDLNQKLVAWKLYFSLTELITCFNLILNKKYV